MFVWLVLGLCCCFHASVHGSVEIWERWGTGGFKGNIKITPQKDYAKDEWTIILECDKCLTSVESWTATVKNPPTCENGGSSVKLVHIPQYNQDLTAGDSSPFLPTFVIIGRGNDPNSCKAYFSDDPSSADSGDSEDTDSTGYGDSDLANKDYDYGEVLGLSILFYEAQRSGKLPDDNRISWRGDSALNDGSDNGVDLTGGWYDAGDHVKFNFPQAFAVTMLAWGVLEFKEGYVAAGEYENVLDSIKWPLDYLLKCDQLDTSGKLWAQVGDGYKDHAYWGRAEEMTMERPSSYLGSGKCGSELAGETAAAFAAGSMVFKEAGDTEYAAELLKSAIRTRNFAQGCKGSYANSLAAQVGSFYSSWSGYEDELCWAETWLARATGDSSTYQCASSWSDPNQDFGWDNKQSSSELMKVILGDSSSKSNVQSFLNKWYNCQTTPKGLAWFQEWGPNRYSANAAFLALVAAKYGIDEANAETFAKSQINYMLGAGGRSFVIGFGENPPNSPHHRGASCPDTGSCGDNEKNAAGPSPQILYGALVGGPDLYDNFENDRNDYIKNEVAIDYNAGFQSALAGLAAQNTE